MAVLSHVGAPGQVCSVAHVAAAAHVGNANPQVVPPAQVGHPPQVGVRSHVNDPWHVIAPVTQVLAPAQVTLPKHVCALLQVAEPTHEKNPAHVLKFGHVLPPHVPAGAQVGAPAQVPKMRHDGFGAHDATPAHVGLPGIVAGTHKFAQLAIAIVGGQFTSPGQLGDPSHVGQFATPQVANDENVGGGGTSSQMTLLQELKFDHVIHAGPLSQLCDPSSVMHDPTGHVKYPEKVGHSQSPGQLAIAIAVGQAPSPQVAELVDVGQSHE